MLIPRFLSLSEIIDPHADQIASFGGSFGVRDLGLLISALAQPQATFGGQLLHDTIGSQAGAYLYHLSRNHPFIDGNKRTALAAMDTFIRLNNYTLELTDEQTYNLVMQCAQGELNKDDLMAFLTTVISKKDIAVS